MRELFIILIILAGLFALIQVFRVKDTFSRVINGVFAVALGVTMIPVPAVAIDGYYLFLIGCLLVILYTFSDNSFGTVKKSLLIVMAGIQLFATLFWLQQWPGADILSLACLITVGIYVFVITKEIRTYQIEIGFLTVLMVDGLIKSIIALSEFLGGGEPIG